jgi:predicted amidophosphoribosyltransferase
MIRVFFASLGVALLIGVIFGIPGAIVPIFVVLFVLVALNNVGKLKCPHCGKRVKLDAGVCHHCGRDVKSYAMRLAEMRRAGHAASMQNVLPPPPPLASTRQPVSTAGGQAEAKRLSSPANYCCSCGAPLHAGARFCSGCGVAV